MLNGYSLKGIVEGQLASLDGHDASAPQPWAIAFFFFVPLISPLVQTYWELNLNKDIVSTIISATSIFAGLLLNLLVVVYGFSPDEISVLEKTDKKAADNLGRLIECCFFNISYAVLISGVLVIFCLIFLTEVPQVAQISQLIIYYLGFQLFLSIALVLTRCHNLLDYRVTRRRLKRDHAANNTWN